MKRRTTLITAAVVAACAVLPSVASAATTSTLTASPASVDLGTTSDPTPTEATVTVTNTGPNPVHITTVNTNAAAFAVTYTTCVSAVPMPAGSTCYFMVEFDPRWGLGSWSGTVRVNGTDTVTATAVGTLVVPVSATAVAPPLPVMHLGSSAVSRASFYPLVQDRYLDVTRYSASFTEPATGKVQVLNSVGRVVKAWPFTNRTSVAEDWRGRSTLGTKVKSGTYRFRVIAHGVAGTSTGSVSGGLRSTVVRTGWRAVHHAIDRTGVNTTSRHKGGSGCLFERGIGPPLSLTRGATPAPPRGESACRATPTGCATR